MITECLDTELSILYALFKYKKDGLKVFDSSTSKVNQFANFTHREIANILCDKMRKDDYLTPQSFLIHYKTMKERSEKDILKVKEALRELKTHSCTIEDMKTHCITLTDLHVRRMCLSALNDSVDTLDKDFDGTLSVLEKRFAELRRERNPKQVQTVMGLRTHLQDRKALAKDIHDNPDKVGMCELGFKNIDKHIGRQAPGEFVLYQARTNTGKSMFLMHTALHNYRRGLKGIIVTIEMSASQYLYRMDSCITGIEHREFSAGTISNDLTMLTDWENSVNNCSKISEDLLVYWVPSNCTPAKLRTIIANNPFKPDFVVVDYAGDMKAGIPGVSDYDAGAFGVIYSSLKEFAGEFNCVMYSAQQTKRGVKKVDTESGSWSDIASHKADIMVALEITKEDEDFMTEYEGIVYNGRMTISIVKGRNIPKCKTQIIPVFHKMTFIEKEVDEMMGVGFTHLKTNKQRVKESSEKNEKQTASNNNKESVQIQQHEEELNLLD